MKSFLPPFVVMVLALVGMSSCSTSRGIPVIYDTDIGADVDDTWALALIQATAVGDRYDTTRHSSTLFDTVAVWLTWDDTYWEIKDVRFRVTRMGHTLPDPQGKQARAAVKWKDRDAFCNAIADRIANYRP